jgi:putative ABC transport system permease protein
MPTGKNEVVLVTDKYNRIDIAFFEKLGITENTENYKLTDFVSKTILKVIPNDDYYTKNGDLFTTAAPTDYEKLYDSDTGTKLTITGILRSKKEVSSSYLSPGIAYSTVLTAAVVEDAQKSGINLAGISKIASLNTLHAAALVAGSMILTLIAGFIPSGMAAKKDPVVALRSE